MLVVTNVYDYISYQYHNGMSIRRFKFQILSRWLYKLSQDNGILCALREAGFKRQAFINKRLITKRKVGAKWKQHQHNSHGELRVQHFSLLCFIMTGIPTGSPLFVPSHIYYLIISADPNRVFILYVPSFDLLTSLIDPQQGALGHRWLLIHPHHPYDLWVLCPIFLKMDHWEGSDMTTRRRLDLLNLVSLCSCHWGCWPILIFLTVPTYMCLYLIKRNLNWSSVRVPYRVGTKPGTYGSCASGLNERNMLQNECAIAWCTHH